VADVVRRRPERGRASPAPTNPTPADVHRPMARAARVTNARVPAHEAMAISGHRTGSAFDRYSLPLKAQTRAALERVRADTLAGSRCSTALSSPSFATMSTCP